MDGLRNSLSYGSPDEAPSAMDFPTSLASSIDPTGSSYQNLIQQSMQYGAVGPGMQREALLAAQTNAALQRSNAFDLPRFQLPYQQPVSVPGFASFAGGSFSPMVPQRSQFTSASLQAMSGMADHSSLIPQLPLSQQHTLSIPSVDKLEPLPNFSSIVASAASSISTMNVQPLAVGRSSSSFVNSQMSLSPSPQSRMSTMSPHSISRTVESPVRQASNNFFGNSQPIPPMHSDLKTVHPQIIQRFSSKSSQSTDSVCISSAFSPSSVAKFDSHSLHTSSSTRNHEAALNRTLFPVSGGCVTPPPDNYTTQHPPSTFSNPSFSGPGLAPLSVSTEQEPCPVSLERNALLPEERHLVSKQTPFNDGECLTTPEMPSESNETGPQDTPCRNADSSRRHSIDSLEHGSGEDHEEESDLSLVSFTSSSHSRKLMVKFYLLGRLGDQAPWRHTQNQTFDNFFDSSDFEDSYLQGNESFGEFRVKEEPDPVPNSSYNSSKSASSFNEESKGSHDEANESEDVEGESVGAKTVRTRAKNMLSSDSKFVRRRKYRGVSQPKFRDSNNSANGRVSEPVPPGDDDRSDRDDSSVDPDVLSRETPDKAQIGDDRCQTNDSKSSANPKVFFQVKPDIDDLPYFDYMDKEDTKSLLLQATKEKLESERMDVHVKVSDSQYVTVGDQKRWQCHLCPKNYTTKHNLVTHILDHSGIKPHLCMVCGKYFKQLSHLNTHMLTHDNIKPHVCNLCGKSFTQISHLKRHQTVHLENKPHICDICNRGFAYPSELRAHKEKHIPGRDKCVDCGQEFPSPKLLKQHQATHEQREFLSCNQCSRVFRYPSQLRDHLLSHSGARPFICTECGMDFMKEHHLKAHMFTHTGLRPYACEECGRSFNQKANLQRHMLIHSSERAYKCEQCEKTFTQPQTLKAHMVVHAEKKPYCCDICGKEFGRLHNLQGHMHMHNNTKPYTCFCGSSFTLKGNLNRHKKIKHGLNETTESMEEEAVNFLSLMSERVREERTIEGEEDSNTREDLDTDNMLMGQSGDLKSHRRERKSTPRKIPRQRKSLDNDESKDDFEEEDEDEEEAAATSQYFKPLSQSTPRLRTNKRRLQYTDTPEEKRVTRGQRLEVKEEADEDSASSNEKDDGRDDDEWMPSKKRSKQGSKLDSLIARKFQNT